MIWQEDVKQVIMLTNLMEGIKVNININMKYLNDHVMSFIMILETYNYTFIFSSGSACSIGQIYKQLWRAVVSQFNC